MKRIELHCIYDPLCGWCYGAAPLLAAARQLDGLRLILHGGGMMSGAGRRPVTPELRRRIISHDRRIAAQTGQPFGAAYFDGLLCATDAVFDSTPPIAAVLAAEACARAGGEMLAAIQRAHYVDGRRIADPATLQALAEALGIDRFAAALEVQLAGPVDTHIAASRRLLGAVGGRGFPTYALACGDGFRRVDADAFLGQPQGWQAHLLATAETLPDALPRLSPDQARP